MQKNICPRCGAENYTASRLKLPPCHNCGYDFNLSSDKDLTEDKEEFKEAEEEQ